MTWYFTGAALLLQIGFWGLGLTWLIVPAPWRRFWPAFWPAVGIALQSAVVWTGAHTALPGTDAYVPWAQLLPGLLLVAAVARLGVPAAWKLFRLGFQRWAGLWLAMAASLAFAAYPMTKPPAWPNHALTSVSIGSCDAADYAAGARVLREFSRRDRSGFNGDVEVTQIGSVDNFFDFWLRLNHFTPSALLALNSTLLGLPPHELVTLLGIVLLTLNLPAVFWLARAGFRFGPAASTWLALVYGVSPILFYAVYQTALGQLLAAPAVALLTWVGVRAFRGPGTVRQYARFAGLLLVCNWLVLGSYNFFVLFCYAPAVAYVGARTLLFGPGARTRTAWKRAGGWAVFVALGLLACVVLFPERVTSLPERFELFQKTEFGWRIPPFWPSGWFGMFADVKLSPAAGWLPALLAAACLLALGAAVVFELRRRRFAFSHPLLLAAAAALPGLAGYSILVWQTRTNPLNSGYDAYKLFCVFYPGLLAALCLWLRPGAARFLAVGGGPGDRRRVWAVRGVAALLAAGLLWANVAVAGGFNAVVRRTPWRVAQALTQLEEVERLPNLTSLNLCVESYWSRLWANYFLLNKPQYFALRTYEGRRVTPLRGAWDLRDGFLNQRPAPGQGEFIPLEKDFVLVDRRGPAFVDLQLGSGWYPAEQHETLYWCWSGGSPDVVVENPHPYPVQGRLRFMARGFSPRPLAVRVNDTLAWQGRLRKKPRRFKDIPVEFPPGRNLLHLETPAPPAAGPNDPRPLTLALFRLQLEDLSAVPPTGTAASAQP